jgi:hypothetical protein
MISAIILALLSLLAVYMNTMNYLTPEGTKRDLFNVIFFNVTAGIACAEIIRAVLL